MKLTFLLLVLVFSARAQTASSIIDRYLTVSGGRDKIDKLESCREIAYSWLNLNFLGLDSMVKSTIEGIAPSKHTTTMMIPVFDFSKLENAKGEPPMLFFYNDKGGGIVQYGMYIENPFESPFVTLTPAKNILISSQQGLMTFAGEQLVFNEDCYVMYGPNVPGSDLTSKFFFSKRTGLLVAKDFSKPGIPRLEKYDDYKKVDGMLVPLKNEMFANGVLFFRSIIDSLVFNPPIDKSIFYYKETKNKNQKPPEGTVIHKSIQDGDLLQVIQNTLNGKRVFIDLWATWCGPCKYEFSKYDSAFYKALSELDVNLLFISIDKEKDRKKWEADISKFRLKGDHVLAQKQLLKSIRELIYNNQQGMSIPRYIVIDEHGKILSTDFVRPSTANFADSLRSLFAR